MSELAITPTGGAAQGAQFIGQGITNGMKAMAMGGDVREQAAQKTALALSRIYANNMSGDKHGEETRGIKMTNDGRASVETILADNPQLEQYLKSQLVAFKMAGPQYMDNFSRSGQIEQKISDIQAIKADPSKATPAAQAYFATSGSAPFDNVGNTGASLNRATGAQNVTSDVINKLYEAKGSGKGKAADGTIKPNDVIKNDLAIDRLAQGAWDKEYPKDAFGKRPTGAPTLQDYVTTYRDAREKRSGGGNKNPAPGAPAPTITPSADMAAAEAVKAQYKAGKITRDQAKKQLEALGMINQ